MSEIIIFNDYEKTYNAVLSRAYGLLGLSVIAMIIGIILGGVLLTKSRIDPFILYGLILVAYLGCSYFGKDEENNRLAITILLGIAGLLGLSLGVGCAHLLSTYNGVSVLATAAGGVCLTLLALALITSASEDDLNIMAAFIYIGLLAAVMAAIAYFILHFSPLGTFMVAASIAAAGAALSYQLDTFFEQGDDNPVLMAFRMYLGIYFMFYFFFSLFSSFNPTSLPLDDD